jgi:hypothetical protein
LTDEISDEELERRMSAKLFGTREQSVVVETKRPRKLDKSRLRRLREAAPTYNDPEREHE